MVFMIFKPRNKRIFILGWIQIWIIFLKSPSWSVLRVEKRGWYGVSYLPPTISIIKSSVQYSTVQYSTLQYTTVHYSTVQYSTIQYNTVQYSAVQYSTVSNKFSFLQFMLLKSIPNGFSNLKINKINKDEIVKYGRRHLLN